MSKRPIEITEKDTFKLTDKQLKKIKDLVHKLKMECNLAKAPMFVTFVKENSAEGTVYEHDMVFATTGTSLKDNRIGKILLRINGCQTKLPKEVQDAVRILENYLLRESVVDVDENYENIEMELEDNMLLEMQDIIVDDVDVFFDQE